MQVPSGWNLRLVQDKRTKLHGKRRIALHACFLFSYSISIQLPKPSLRLRRGEKSEFSSWEINFSFPAVLLIWLWTSIRNGAMEAFRGVRTNIRSPFVILEMKYSFPRVSRITDIIYCILTIGKHCASSGIRSLRNLSRSFLFPSLRSSSSRDILKHRGQ